MRTLSQKTSVPCSPILAGRPTCRAHRLGRKHRHDKLCVHTASVSTLNSVEAKTNSDAARAAPAPVSEANLAERLTYIRGLFPGAIGMDDFISRVEIALCSKGFKGENSIAMTNLCRDEITTVLKDKIEAAFGSSFNTNGLGGILTCGITGIGAGLSHAPKVEGRERYVFFSFPHIAVDASGAVGMVMRPGRPGTSCACGALIKCLSELKAEGLAPNCRTPGVHEALDPEYSVLKQRLARRIRYEGLDVASMSLVDITKVAERTITDDLEYLIEEVVDTTKADYAIVTGIQVHNWATDLRNAQTPSMEFVVPSRIFTVVEGKVDYVDIASAPPLSPRQEMILARRSMAPGKKSKGKKGKRVSSNELLQQMEHSYSMETTLIEVPHDYLAARVGGGAGRREPEVKGALQKGRTTPKVQPAVSMPASHSSRPTSTEGAAATGGAVQVTDAPQAQPAQAPVGEPKAPKAKDPGPITPTVLPSYGSYRTSSSGELPPILYKFDSAKEQEEAALSTSASAKEETTGTVSKTSAAKPQSSADSLVLPSYGTYKTSSGKGSRTSLYMYPDAEVPSTEVVDLLAAKARNPVPAATATDAAAAATAPPSLPDKIDNLAEDYRKSPNPVSSALAIAAIGAASAVVINEFEVIMEVVGVVGLLALSKNLVIAEERKKLVENAQDVWSNIIGEEVYYEYEDEEEGVAEKNEVKK